MAINKRKSYFETIMGDKVVGCWRVTMDGSATTLDLPVGTIDFAFIAQSVGSSIAGTSISWSGSTVTFSSALTAGNDRDIFFFGTA